MERVSVLQSHHAPTESWGRLGSGAPTCQLRGRIHFPPGLKEDGETLVEGRTGIFFLLGGDVRGMCEPLALSHLGSSEGTSAPILAEDEFKSWTIELALAAGQAPDPMALPRPLWSAASILPSPYLLSWRSPGSLCLGHELMLHFQMGEGSDHYPSSLGLMYLPPTPPPTPQPQSSFYPLPGSGPALSNPDSEQSSKHQP